MPMVNAMAADQPGLDLDVVDPPDADGPSAGPCSAGARTPRPTRRVAGVDEAGRGPLAGPLFVAAVVLRPRKRIAGLDDSKKLTAKRREDLYARIVDEAVDFSIVEVSVSEIDCINIYQATMIGMCRALIGLNRLPDLALVDGNRLPGALPCPGRAIVGGDASEPAISAASILAKVSRDRMLDQLDSLYPGYGFAQHKGYSTPEHFAALAALGPCPIHRRSFAPVRESAMRDLFDTA
jgi:ribonuclease HII